MARRHLLALLAAVAALLVAGLAGVSPAARGAAVALATADLRVGALQTGDLSPERRSALTRGSFAMAAVESSRRKPKATRRPPAESLILTSRGLAEGRARAEMPLRPWPHPPLRSVQADRLFPARGPPAWTCA